MASDISQTKQVLEKLLAPSAKQKRNRKQNYIKNYRGRIDGGRNAEECRNEKTD